MSEQSVERSSSATTISESTHKPPPPRKAPKPQIAETLSTQPELSPSATATRSQTLSETADTQTAAKPQSKQLDLSSEQSQDHKKTKSLPVKINGNQLLAGIILLLINN